MLNMLNAEVLLSGGLLIMFLRLTNLGTAVIHV